MPKRWETSAFGLVSLVDLTCWVLLELPLIFILPKKARSPQILKEGIYEPGVEQFRGMLKYR